MIGFIKRLLKFADKFAPRIKAAFVISFLEGISSNAPMIAVLYVLMKITEGRIILNDVWISGGMTLGGALLSTLLRRIFVMLQGGAGYEICARERIRIGDRLKRFPMSFFTEGNLGNVTSVIATDLLFIEENSMSTLDKVITAYAHMMVGVLMLLYIDYRVALTVLMVFLAAIFGLNKMQAMMKEHGAVRQQQQSELTSSVIEYTQGISVIKSLNMAGEKARSIQETFKKTRDQAIRFEKQFIWGFIHFETYFSVGTALVILLVSYFYVNGSMALSTMLMLLIFVFKLYLPAKALGGITAQIRVIEAGLDRYEKLKAKPIIDEDGSDIPLTRFDVAFRNVTFAYEEVEILKDISFKVPERSMTALVGLSGSGKTTIANLVARFWDVQQGEVLVGGVDVKSMTCDSLLRHIGMVFQNVHLFNDTILNNIKFGKPEATYEEIVAAAKKARCHDFISALEKGYDTMVGEGGSTLSGGEKQRISIARAILKDAPIVMLDEATASVDPDNEKHIQMAINELVKNKTLIVIAHRLSTIRSADQILVIDEGKILQKGTHDELIQQQGLYFNLWESRRKAKSWKIAG